MIPDNIWILLAEIIIFLLAVVFHEYAHAYIAYKCGDPTPKIEGRLSFNPLKHLDPIGLFLLFIIGIGFAKPVLINPAYFEDRVTCSRKVALAGPLTNLVLGLLAGVVGVALPVSGFLAVILQYTFFINVGLGFFNLIPLWPLDGHHILLSYYPQVTYNFQKFKQISIVLLIIMYFTHIIDYLIIIPTQLIYTWIQTTF